MVSCIQMHLVDSGAVPSSLQLRQSCGHHTFSKRSAQLAGYSQECFVC